MSETPASIFPDETDDEIYDRIVADFESINVPGIPDGTPYNKRQGSVIHAFLYPHVQQHRRTLDAAEFLLGLGFLKYSQGEYLDAKALEFGVIRTAAVASQVTLTFTGDTNTVIPVGTEVSTEATDNEDSVTFRTTSQVTIAISGHVTVNAIALEPGVTSNVSVGELTILSTPITGVAEVTNETAAVGGLDTEDDESLRSKALARARSIPQGGNKETYETISLRDAEVKTVYVEDFWNGNGSARVIVGGVSTPYVSTVAVERLQQQIDPTVKNLAHFEGEAWAGGNDISSTPLEGQSSRSLTPALSATAAMTLDKTLNLSAWNASTDEVWIDIKRVSAAANLSNFKLMFYSPGGASVAKAEATVSAATINGLSGITTGDRLVLLISDFVITNGTDTFSWGTIGGIQLSVTSTASGASELHFDGLRIRRKAGGFQAGQATVGIQITMRSARQLQVTVGAIVELEVGLTVADVQTSIEEDIEELFANAAPGTEIKLSEIANIIHDTPGVVDYLASTLELNGVNANLVLTADQRPTFSSLTLTAV